MAVTVNGYNSYFGKIQDGSIDLDTDTIKVVLVTSAYTFNSDTHTQYSHITNQVANGNGYTTGGATLANKAIAVDNAANLAKFTANNVVWNDSTISAAGAILYKYIDNAGSPAAASPLICFVAFGETVISNAGSFTIAWPDNVIKTLAQG